MNHHDDDDERGGRPRDRLQDGPQADSGGLRSRAGSNYGDFRGAASPTLDADNDVERYYGSRATPPQGGFEGSHRISDGPEGPAYPGGSGRFQPGGGTQQGHGFGPGSQGGYSMPTRPEFEPGFADDARGGGVDAHRPHGGAHGEASSRGVPFGRPGAGWVPGRQPQGPASHRPPGEDDDHDLHDPDYQRWRAEQMRSLDDDYRQWRKDRYKKFSEEFSQWRSQRASAAPQGGASAGAPGGDLRPPGADGPATNPGGGDPSGSNAMIPMERNPLSSHTGPTGSARPGAGESDRDATAAPPDAGATADRV